MDKKQAYELFDRMIQEAQKTLLSFTQSSSLGVTRKADRSVVTECDRALDSKLTSVVNAQGFETVSEEGEQVQKIVQSGNYVTIDPIDGTLGYIDYVNKAVDNGELRNVFSEDLGPSSDFCLLIGVVQNGLPRFGACYNYVTREKIFVDGENRNNLVRNNDIRNYSQKYAIYLDQRPTDDDITKKLLQLPGVNLIKQATLGLKSLYTIINPHEAAITVHLVQTAGLWDILPAAVACRVFGGNVYDGLGNELKLDSYIILPGNGAIIIKGDKF